MSEEILLEHAKTHTTDFLMYTGQFCGYCSAAKRLLNSKDFTFTEISFDEQPDLRKPVVEATGHRTVPVILDIRGEQPVFVCGFDLLQPYLRQSS